MKNKKIEKRRPTTVVTGAGGAPGDIGDMCIYRGDMCIYRMKKVCGKIFRFCYFEFAKSVLCYFV